jgi:hypothetical protein
MESWAILPLIEPLEFDFSIGYDPQLQDLLFAASTKPISVDIHKVKDFKVLDSFMTIEYCKGVLDHNPWLIREMANDYCGYIINAILQSNIDVQTLEIVRQLITDRLVDNEFIHTFIDYCIRTIADRYARMICLFLEFVINDGVITKSEAVIYSSFLLKYSKIKECVHLYQAINS